MCSSSAWLPQSSSAASRARPTAMPPRMPTGHTRSAPRRGSCASARAASSVTTRRSRRHRRALARRRAAQRSSGRTPRRAMRSGTAGGLREAEGGARARDRPAREGEEAATSARGPSRRRRGSSTTTDDRTQGPRQVNTLDSRRDRFFVSRSRVSGTHTTQRRFDRTEATELCPLIIYAAPSQPLFHKRRTGHDARRVRRVSATGPRQPRRGHPAPPTDTAARGVRGQEEARPVGYRLWLEPPAPESLCEMRCTFGVCAVRWHGHAHPNCSSLPRAVPKLSRSVDRSVGHRPTYASLDLHEDLQEGGGVVGCPIRRRRDDLHRDA